MMLKRGMNEWRHNVLKLNFSDYLNRSQLPRVPRQFGYVRRSDVPWDMLGNDAYGDCVMAGACHETMLWNMAIGKPAPRFDTKDVVQQYLKQTGGDDAGLDPLAFAAHRHDNGITDSDGVVHKVDEYAAIAVDDFDMLDLACYIFGTCGVGVNMPDSGEQEFTNHTPWTDTSGAPAGGHYVPYAGLNSRGQRFFITWGALQAARLAWLEKYLLGAVAYFSMEFIRNGVSPGAIKVADMRADWASLHKA